MLSVGSLPTPTLTPFPFCPFDLFRPCHTGRFRVSELRSIGIPPSRPTAGLLLLHYRDRTHLRPDTHTILPDGPTLHNTCTVFAPSARKRCTVPVTAPSLDPTSPTHSHSGGETPLEPVVLTAAAASTDIHTNTDGTTCIFPCHSTLHPTEQQRRLAARAGWTPFSHSGDAFLLSFHPPTCTNIHTHTHG